MVSHRFGRNRRHHRMSLPCLLWIVLVASSPCDHVVARTDAFPKDRGVSFRRQRRHIAEERLDEPPLRGEGRYEEGENDEYENDDEETLTDGEPYREEQTRDYAYRYDRGNEDEYQESSNITTTPSTIPDIYDPDETDPNYVPLQEEIPERSTTRSIDASSSSRDDSPKSTWIAHGTLGTLSFGLLVPLAVSSALFRDLFPSYWIYIHVFFNVAVFAATLLAVGVAFATMHSLGDANEGHWKERHHIVGLGVLLLVTFQTANGFLRPPREFVDEEDEEEEEGEGKVSPRAVWRRMHRATGLGIVALGTWQVRSGMEIFARKFGTADWGGVYLGYMGWVGLVMGGGKMWMKVREKKGIGKNEWNAEDELFDTDGLRRGLEDD